MKKKILNPKKMKKMRKIMIKKNRYLSRKKLKK